MIPDSSDLDAAIVGLLQADPTLHSLMPDGVYMDEAPPGVQRFVLLGIMDSSDRVVYPAARAGEEIRYFAKAVALSTAGANMKAAAFRIDELLGAARLTPPAGYAELAIMRDTEQPRIRDIEVDRIDPAIRWFHRGAYYRLEAAIG